MDVIEAKRRLQRSFHNPGVFDGIRVIVEAGTGYSEAVHVIELDGGLIGFANFEKAPIASASHALGVRGLHQLRPDSLPLAYRGNPDLQDFQILVNGACQEKADQSFATGIQKQHRFASEILRELLEKAPVIVMSPKGKLHLIFERLEQRHVLYRKPG